MSSVFPNLSKIPDNVSKTIKSRAGKNVLSSTLMPWIRVIGSGGLVIESFQSKYKPDGANTDDNVAPKKNFSTEGFGTRYGNNSKSGRVGTDFNGNSVYAESNDRGFRPSPTIDGLTVENGQSGLSRKCKFTIKCYSLGQAEKVSEFFLEPGYTCLVEFGFNTKLAKEQKLRALNPCNIARYNNFIYVNDKRKKSEGHYDAFLGYITGGGIKSGDGETYECDVELTTLGEIPAYLQQHKGDSQAGDETAAGDAKYDVSKIEDDIDGSNIGLALFKQMFNRLPGSKQTQKVKDLSKPESKDYLGTPWTSAHNFINIDDDIREKLSETFQDVDVTLEGGETGKIPQGAPLFTDQSYIRLELAFKILNETRYKLTATKPKNCTAVKKGYSFVIDTNTTICRAFPNMFSADNSILYIPNAESPEFGLSNVLTSEKEENFLLPFIKGKDTSVFIGKTVNNNPAEKQDGFLGKDAKQYRFPSSVDLKWDTTFETFNKIDSDVLTQNINGKYWGYLRNLYINFDFFCEVISRSNYVTKDIYYELLNGISTAVNSHWYFEIVDLCDSDGDSRLTVRDLSLVGLESPSILDTVDKFDSKGIKTPFLSSQLSFDIPAAMKGHVLGKRVSSKAEVIKDGQTPEVKRLFSKKMDPVLDILNSLKIEEEAEVETETKSEANTDEIRKANYDLFMGKASVISFLIDRNNIPDATEGFWDWKSDNTPLSKFASVGGWNSTDALTMLSKNSKGDSGANPILLPIKFTFEIHGVSGIRVGDLFKINDLPEKYKLGVFQVTETSHQIESSIWKTTVNGEYRQIE